MEGKSFRTSGLKPLNLSVALLAIPSIIGSFAVLYLAAVGREVWVSHLIAIVIACLLILGGNYMSKLANRRIMAFTIIVLTCTGLVMTLFGGFVGPNRWISVGPVSLYFAPVLLPSFIAACASLGCSGRSYQVVQLIAIALVAFVLAMQPDASQVLGLLIALTVFAMRYRFDSHLLRVTLFLLILLTLWAFLVPDPLEPVPHVEGVFELAFEHSLLTGVSVLAAALVLVVGLWINSMNGAPWLTAVAAYYASLFMCSAAGLTPAPLIGYGAGAILGFGLMVAILACLGPRQPLAT